MKIQQVFKPLKEFEEIDITKALTTSGRMFYPKIARKTRIDDFLARRTHLKLLEERRMSQSEKIKDIAKRGIKKGDADGDADIENTEGREGDKPKLQSTLLSKPVNKIVSPATREMIAVITKRIQQVKSQYGNLSRVGTKNQLCYSKYCNLASQNMTKGISQSLLTQCYSPTCLKKSQLKRDLVVLLRKLNALNNNSNNFNSLLCANKTVQSPIPSLKTEISEKKEKEIKSEDTKINEKQSEEQNEVKTEIKSEIKNETVDETKPQLDVTVSEASASIANEKVDLNPKPEAAASDNVKDEPPEKLIKLETVRIDQYFAININMYLS